MTHLLSWLLSLILLVSVLSQVLGNQAIMPYGTYFILFSPNSHRQAQVYRLAIQASPSVAHQTCLSLPVSSSSCGSFSEKSPVVIVNLRLYESRKRSPNPSAVTPLPIKRTCLLDTVELIEEVEKKVHVNWRKSDLPAREKAVLELALAISQADDITDDQFRKLEMHGFSQEDAWDYHCHFSFICHVQLACSSCSQQGIVLMGRTNNVKDIKSKSAAAPKV